MQRSAPFVLALLAAVPCANAATFCVTNGTELAQALATATSNAQADTIRLTAGTFTTAAPTGFVATVAAFGIELEGGWLSLLGDCNLRVDDPTLTVIDGQATRPGLRVTGSASNGVSGDLVVRNMTFANGRRFGANGDRGGGLLVSAASGWTGDVLVERNVFRANASDQFAGGVHAASDGGIVTVRNNLVTGNSALVAAGIYAFGNGATTYVSNNTVVGNVATDATTPIAAYDRGGGNDVFVSNNIFWGNTTATQFDLSALSGATVLIVNDIERRSGAPQGASIGNVSVDPRFVGASDFRLRDDSPLLDSGATPPLGGLSTLDLDGKARVGGGLVEPGAYEIDRVFRDGFES